MTFFATLRSRLVESHTRQLIWLETERDSLSFDLDQLLNQLNYQPDQGVLIGAEPVAGLTPVGGFDAVRLLGETLLFAVVDAHSGFNPNAVAQVAGTLSGGGVLILVSPKAALWRTFDDPEYAHLGYTRDESAQQARPAGRYLRYLINQLESDPRVIRVSSPTKVLPAFGSTRRSNCVWPYRSLDQHHAVSALVNLLEQGRSTALMTADRGRGKSTAIGIALAQQQTLPTEVIWICGPKRSAADALYQGFELVAGQQPPPNFALPAELLNAVEAGAATPRLIVIDEAASIPTPVLERLAGLSDHLLLSTTLHGYEGHGGGFALRFIERLGKKRGQITRLGLNEPIRWSAADTLEPLLDQVLMMGLESAGGEIDSLDAVDYQQLDLNDLVENQSLLAAVFQLLSEAHYRTSPSDLRVLLDSPEQSLWIARNRDRVLGVLWSVTESVNDPALAEAIMQGYRRPSGNLLPQTFLFHEGWLEAQYFTFERVVRIAVAEPVRQRGIGGALLSQLEQACCNRRVDILGTSFAFYPKVASFWARSGFEALRLGDQLDSVAASPAMVMAKPLTAEAHAWTRLAQAQFCDRLRYLDAVLDDTGRAWIDQRMRCDLGLHIGQRDAQCLANFAKHKTPVSLVRPALSRLDLSAASDELAGIIKKALTSTLNKGETQRLRERLHRFIPVD